MNSEKSILFVCTGNIFRSMSAEYTFKKYLSEQNISNWKVGSAGTIAQLQPADPKVLETLQKFGVSCEGHQQSKVSKELLESYDVVVAMAQDHIDFLASEFGYNRAILFDTLATQEDTSVLDVEDEVLDYQTNRAAVEAKIEHTVTHIHDKIPELFKNAAERFYLFSDFVSGEKKHRNGFPFIPLHETPHTVAFMSVDIPSHTDSHILVIPKKRFSDFSQVPEEIARELITTLARIGGVLGASHDGYNILLNNGRDAGQYIFHTHFHVVPRMRGDGIAIETWQSGTLTLDRFLSLNDAFKKQMAGATPSAPKQSK